MNNSSPRVHLGRNPANCTAAERTGANSRPFAPTANTPPSWFRGPVTLNDQRVGIRREQGVKREQMPGFLPDAPGRCSVGDAAPCCRCGANQLRSSTVRSSSSQSQSRDHHPQRDRRHCTQIGTRLRKSCLAASATPSSKGVVVLSVGSRRVNLSARPPHIRTGPSSSAVRNRGDVPL